MAGSRWQIADEFTSLPCCPEETKKRILFARIYTSRQGYSYSPTNQYILNLKIPVPTPGNRAQYKSQAISLFASEVVDLLTESGNQQPHFVITPMPPSKMESHPNFDDRMEKVARIVASRCPNIHYVKLLRASRNIEAAHLSGSARSVSAFRDTMEVVPRVSLERFPYAIIVIDDVLTTGAHFEAARQLLSEKFPGRSISGIFWAKAVSATPSTDF